MDSRKELEKIQVDTAYEVLKKMKERDVNVATWVLILLSMATGIVKLFTYEYVNFYNRVGKSILIQDNWIGIALIIVSFAMVFSLNKAKIKNVSIKRMAIILTTCCWTYLAFEYFMISILLSINMTWLAIIGIISICFYIMVRGDYN